MVAAFMAIISFNVWADMRVEGMSEGLVSNPEYPFEGKITFVNYYYFNGTEPKIQVDTQNSNNESLSVTFTGVDLPLGMSLMNAVGKPLVVEFSDNKFSVAGLFTYDNTDQNNNAMKKFHAAFQSKIKK